MVDFPGYSLSGVVASFFFVLLSMKQSDDFRVIGSAHPTLVMVGEDALLTCQLLPKRTTRHMEVRWYRSELSTPVFLYGDGAEVTEMQMEEYRGRVEWIEDNVTEGSVALKIHNIRPSDHGQYWCHFQEGNYCGETSLLLNVAGLGSDPYIHMDGSVESGLQLVCTAKGWFPEPQISWQDIRGEKLLTISKHSIQDEDGLFYVESTLVVRNVSTEIVSCFIYSPTLTEERGSDISIPEKLQTELASLKVIGPSQPILVRVGEDIQLTCSLSPKTDAQSMEVRWVRSHRYPAVYVYMDGDHVAGEQMAEYRGRTALVSDAINEGRLTLQINNARTSDDGKYQCLFEKDGVYQEADLDLKIVGLGSSPRISMEALKDGETKLKCTSEGWFPQPHVQWRDMEGKTIPSVSQDLTQGSQGLFHVEAFLLVKNSSVVNVTCSISNPLLGEEKMTTFSPSEPGMNFSWKILLILGLLPLVGAVGLIWRKSCRKVNETLDPNTAHSELILSEGNERVLLTFSLHLREPQQHLQGKHKDLEEVLKASEVRMRNTRK
ncbi:butyrophilin-like protein 2 [Neophocaena asiaeorientalis asiaeorientalis]|uniref:Butyrophilin-like protein 2 n=2 Tax=Neophocaena asiaeorientalis asiaeorientalis TaxID=1706337 RepID=A0A341CA07_NEOAA|nr:butyrophilin-like protein 2 [Neophocaena asiaeorientalis asiaeorientalis]